MKSLSILCVLLLAVFMVNGQSYIDKDGNENLWGKTNLKEFNNQPYVEWFQENQKDYRSNLGKEDAVKFEDITVKVFIGTWCGDTKFLFPKFIKIWQGMGLSEDKLEIVALHHEDELYKQAPNSETKDLDIHRVPTFIFYRDNEELGRIVERTVFDLETDMLQIVESLPYKHRYQAVAIVSECMQNNLDSLESEYFIKQCEKEVGRELSTDSELNIYGYTLLFGGDNAKAQFVFKLNSALFPYNPYTRYAYGKSLFLSKEYLKAKQEFLEAIRIMPIREFLLPDYLMYINRLLISS